MITLETSYPIAYESPDHIFPWGTKNDNSTNEGFINETLDFWEQRGKSKINFLDLGCSGGQLVVDYNKNLFTCDVTKPYKLLKDNKEIKFDVISAWEVIEHIAENDLIPFFNQINKNLLSGGFFCGSISMNIEVLEGHALHQTVWNEKKWYENFPQILKGTDLELYDYPFQNKVRQDHGSFHVLLLKK